MRRLGPAVLSAVAVAVAAGCGGGHSSSAGNGGHAVSSTGTAAPGGGATQAQTSTAPGGSGTDAPGAALAVGQTATVPYTAQTSPSAGQPTAKLAVTVLSLERGSLSDFNGIQLDASEKAGTPAYVKVRLKNLGPGPLHTNDSDDPAFVIQGVDDTGQTAQSVTFIGTFPRCPFNDAPKPFKVGQTFETCFTFLVPGGITKVAYTGTEDYINSPLTWKAAS